MEPLFSIVLNREGEEPIYRQLIRSIKMQIESGTLAAGTRLPASRDLAQHLQISRISVVNAYAELRAEGFLSAHAGRGTFVSKESPSHTPTPTDERVRFMPHRVEDSTDYSLREMMRLARQPGIINFGQGAPPVDFLPTAYLRAPSTRCLTVTEVQRFHTNARKGTRRYATPSAIT